LDQKTKDLLEFAADVLGVVILADIVWTMVFGQAPPVKGFHDMIAFLGTVAACWLGWKMLRKNKAFG
jgi:hypothetical protein